MSALSVDSGSPEDLARPRSFMGIRSSGSVGIEAHEWMTLARLSQFRSFS